MRLQRWLVATGLGIAGAAAVSAQPAAEVSLGFGTGTFTSKNLGDLTSLGAASQALRVNSTGFRLSARLDLNAWRFLSHEIGYGFQHSKLDFGRLGKYGMNVHHFYYDFLLHALPDESAVRPFVAGGGGFSSFYPPGTSVYSGTGATKPSVNYGAGIKIRVKPTYGLRFDVRDYLSGKPNPYRLSGVSGALHNIETSLGFSILF